jgi:hypothetical protein
MSGYFDGLMRASGLGLGNAPVLGTPPNAALLPEIDGTVPAAAPLVTPLDVAARTMPQISGTSPASPAPSTPQALSARDSPGQTASQAVVHADAEAQPPANAAAQVARPVASARLGTDPAASTVITHERIIQAALQWVAAGSTTATPALFGLSADPAQPRGRAEMSPTATSSASVTKASPIEPDGVRDVTHAVTVQPPRLAVATASLPPAALPMAIPAPRPGPSERDDAVQVSIGAIHLRVEAPPPPSVQAAPAPRPVVPSQTVPRSGLSRRALRRF